MRVYRLMAWKFDKKGKPNLVKTRKKSDFWGMVKLRGTWEEQGYEVHVIQDEDFSKRS